MGVCVGASKEIKASFNMCSQIFDLRSGSGLRKKNLQISMSLIVDNIAVDIRQFPTQIHPLLLPVWNGPNSQVHWLKGKPKVSTRTCTSCAPFSRTSIFTNEKKQDKTKIESFSEENCSVTIDISSAVLRLKKHKDALSANPSNSVCNRSTQKSLCFVASHTKR